MSDAPPSNKIHPTAIIEPDVTIGARTAVWDHVHIRHGASIGNDCIIGEKTYIAYDVDIGNLVKINACVYVCAGVSIANGVMVAAHTVFTNDVTPRACDPELRQLLPSEPSANMPLTRVGEGVTIGANCTIGPGLTLGAFCMVGMGSVVTRSVPSQALVAGNPATLRGVVCRCGQIVARASSGTVPARCYRCSHCDREVDWPTE